MRSWLKSPKKMVIKAVKKARQLLNKKVLIVLISIVSILRTAMNTCPLIRASQCASIGDQRTYLHSTCKACPTTFQALKKRRKVRVKKLRLQTLKSKSKNLIKMKGPWRLKV